MKKLVLLWLVLCMALSGMSFADVIEDNPREKVLFSLPDQYFRVSLVHDRMELHKGVGRFPGITFAGRKVFCLEPHRSISYENFYSYSTDFVINKEHLSKTLSEADMDAFNDIIYYGYLKTVQGDLDLQSTQFMIWQHLGWRPAVAGEEAYFGVDSFLPERLAGYAERKEAIGAMMNAEPGVAEITHLQPGGSAVMNFSEDFPLDKLIVGAVPSGVTYEVSDHRITLSADESFTGGNLELHYDVPDDWVKSYRVLRPNSSNQVMYGWHRPSKVAHSFQLKSISGSVEVINTNEAGDPLSGHGYRLVSETTQREGVTDLQGRLVFDQLPLGEYTLTNTSVQEAYQVDGEERSITLTEADLHQQVRIVHRGFSGGIITINKVNEAKEPLQGVQFGLFKDAREIKTGTTDASGVLVFRDLATGDYSLVEKLVDPHYILEDTPKPVSLSRSEPTAELQITNRKKDISIRVLVQDERELPLPGVKVLLTQEGTTVLTAQTEAGGHVIFNDLPLGDYQVELDEVPMGYEKPQPKTVTLQSKDPRESSISEEVQFSLTSKDYSIQVQKVDEEEKSIQGVRFELLSANREVLDQAITDEKGLVSFSELPFGSYYVKEVETAANYVLEDEPYLVALAEDKDTALVKVTNAKRAYEINVSLVGPQGEPLSGSLISLYGSEGLITQGRTAEEGKVVFKPEEAGTYRVEVTHLTEGYQLTEKSVDVSLVVKDPRAKIISTDVLIGASFAGGEIRLTKEASDGGVLPNVSFGLTLDGESIAQKRTDESGVISFTGLGYGSYELVELSVDPHYTLDSTPQKVTLSEEETKAVLTKTNQRKDIGIDVSIRDDAGSPISGAVIGLYDRERLLQEKTSDQEGTLSFRDLNLGDYTLKPIRVSPVYGAIAEQLVSLESTSPEERAVIEEVILVAQRLKYDVTIKKVDAKGDPLEGILFGLYDREGELIEEKQTNDKGEAVFEGLYADRYSYRELETKDYLILDDTSYAIEITDSNTSIERQLINYSKGVSLVIHDEDGETGTPVSGSVVDILDHEGKVVETGVIRDGELLIKDLEEGEYTLKQQEPAAGYTAVQDLAFSVDPTQALIKDITLKSTKNTVVLARIDADTRESLAGSTLELHGKDGIIDTYETKGLVKLRGLQVGEYTLKEVHAPEHYDLAEAVSFTVKAEDDLLRVELSSRATYTLRIHKVDKYTEVGLPGAVFAIYRDDELLGEYETDEDGFIKADLPHGTYVLKETKAPVGYVNEALELEITLHQDHEVVVTNIKEEVKPEKPGVDHEDVEEKKNEPKTVLPRTGVSTSLGILFLGAGLIALATRLLKKKGV